MLRNYDKMGLLVPAHVDKDSGYRYYEKNQLAVANRIQALKAKGLGLESIKKILDKYNDSKKLSEYLNIQVSIKKEELEEIKNQLNQIENTIQYLEKNDDMLGYSIEIKKIPKRKVACTRGIIPQYNREGILWDKLFEELNKQKIKTSNLSYNIAVFHDEGFKEENVDVEVQSSVGKIGKDTKDIIFKEIDEITAAVVTYEGKYDRINEISELIANWVENNNYVFSGLHFNIYHNSPATETCEEKMVTEVAIPVKRK